MLCIQREKCEQRALGTQRWMVYLAWVAGGVEKVMDYTICLRPISHFPVLNFTVLSSFLNIIHNYKVQELILVLYKQTKGITHNSFKLQST